MGAIKQALLKLQEAYDLDEDEAQQIIDEFVEGKELPEYVVKLLIPQSKGGPDVSRL